MTAAPENRLSPIAFVRHRTDVADRGRYLRSHLQTDPGDAMKLAEVYSMRAQTAHGVVWRWRTNDRAASPSMAFVTYEDCLANAQKSGYTVAPLRSRTP